MRIGVERSRARSDWHTARPSLPGRSQSSTITSYSLTVACSSPASPVAATSTTNPSSWNPLVRSLAAFLSSSINRTRMAPYPSEGRCRRHDMKIDSGGTGRKVKRATGVPGILAGDGSPATGIAAGEERERLLGMCGDPFHDGPEGGQGRVGHGVGEASLEDQVRLVVLATQPALQRVRRHAAGRRAGGDARTGARHRDDLLRSRV